MTPVEIAFLRLCVKAWLRSKFSPAKARHALKAGEKGYKTEIGFVELKPNGDGEKPAVRFTVNAVLFGIVPKQDGIHRIRAALYVKSLGWVTSEWEQKL